MARISDAGAAQVADVQPDQQVGQRPGLRGLDGVLQVAHDDLAEALDAPEHVPVDRVDVAHVGDEAGTHLGSRWVKSWTRCSPKPSMSIAPREAKCSMRPATWAGQSRLVQKVSLSPSRRTSGPPQTGHIGRERPLRRPFVAPAQHRADDLGDDVAGLAHDDRVARAHVLGRDLVLVVEGGQADGRAADEHRLEHGERRGLPGAPDRHLMSFSRVVRSSGGNL